MTNFVIIAVVSFWCSCARCTPRPVQPTAAGTAPKRFHDVAAPRAVPLGTVVSVEGLGKRVVTDRTALRFDTHREHGMLVPGRWDVFVGNDRAAHARAKKLGLTTRKITIEKLGKL